MLRVLFCLPCFALIARAAIVWQPINPQELAATASTLEPEVSAEVMEWRIEDNDRNFPRVQKREEYIRFKIYKPELAEGVTRLQRIVNKAAGEKLEINARLTLPDGSQKLFGPDDVKERKAEKQGAGGGLIGWATGMGATSNEKELFLAVEGIVPGAILEYQLQFKEDFPSHLMVMVAQREHFPVRNFSYAAKLLNDNSDYHHRPYLFNASLAKMEDNPKEGFLRVTARDLPSVWTEPKVGPATDYALTLIRCYESKRYQVALRSTKVAMPSRIDSKPGPWTYYSTIMHYWEKDFSMPTKKVRALAESLTSGVMKDREKAIRIHKYVQDEYTRFSKRETVERKFLENPISLDDVLDWEKNASLAVGRFDFHCLAVSLYRCAGLDARTVLLPDRQLAIFFPEMTSRAFLNATAIAVKLGDKWAFSLTNDDESMPFGILPWYMEGRVGLLALPNKQEFIDVPVTPSRQSMIASKATVALDSSGNAEGDCFRRFTGQTAAILRRRLQKADENKREDIAKESLGFDVKEVELSEISFDGIDEPEKPLQINAKLKWPGLAVSAGDRLILRPSLFHAKDKPLFTASKRRAPVHFKYPFQEVDLLTIRLPDGFEPEGMKNPEASPGQDLFFRLGFSHDKMRGELRGKREFAMELIDVPVDQYPKIKTWYEMVTRCDQHEVVLTKTGSTKAY